MLSASLLPGERMKVRGEFFVSLQIASRGLLALDGFEQGFEITLTKALRDFALNDLKKQRRSILHRLCENLQQITFIIAINQNAQPPQGIQFFIDVANPIGERFVVSRRNLQELDAVFL